MNFVQVPPAALHDSAVMYLATHIFARTFELSGGQSSLPASLVGIIHMSNAKRKFEKKKCLLLYMSRTLTRCQLYLTKEVDTLAWFPSPCSVMDLLIARVNLKEHQADQMDIEQFIPRNIKCLTHKPLFRNTNIQHL